MDLAHFRMINNKIANKGPYEVKEQAYIIRLDRNPAVCMDNNGKDPKTPEIFPE